MGGRGLTIIELLVIIAIIGLLSSVVLVMTSSGRGKARQVAITSQFTNLRSLIAIAENDGSFHFCNPGVNNEALTAIKNLATWFGNQNGDWNGFIDNDGDFGCFSSNIESVPWTIYARDITNFYPHIYWCMDSQGLRKIGRGTEYDPEIEPQNCDGIISGN